MISPSFSTLYRSLRFRLLLWNAGAVLLTGAFILLAVREGVRYTLIFDLDQVLREDVQEIDLHLQPGQQYDWPALQEELNLKAQGHDYHGWFVRFYGRDGLPVWSSVNTPPLAPLSTELQTQSAFSQSGYRLHYRALPHPIEQAASVAVGCREEFIARDMGRIDRLVLMVFGVLLLASPLAGLFLTSRTIKPLADMIRTTARLRPGDLADRVPLRGTGDELDRLAGTVNGLLDRIADYLDQEHDFLAHAAHELRTPLAAIRSSVEVALNGARTEDEYRELLGLVIEQCTALQTLVNQLLLLAETDADRLQTDAEPVALDQVVSRAVEMFQGVAEFRGVALKANLFLPTAVAGNRHHLRQVLNNLLDNAIKFTAARFDQLAGDRAAPALEPATITVSLIRDDERGQARLAIADNGIGLPAEQLPHVFDRFYRTSEARALGPAVMGTGLGLSICKAIVEAHRGAISVTSEPDQGATFIVTLPLLGSMQQPEPVTTGANELLRRT